ncbi:hypothetical protein, partial [Bacillus cereus]|uniref:hypothetical protein n=1 Tax=Bacillus cereus TaxID=1396 RepID=UPI0024BE6A6F
MEKRTQNRIVSPLSRKHRCAERFSAIGRFNGIRITEMIKLFFKATFTTTSKYNVVVNEVICRIQQ